MQIEKRFLGEFTFDNSSVISKIESTINPITDENVMQFAIKTCIDSKIRMGYWPGNGLKIINSKQRKNNPLGEFLGIKKTTYKLYSRFLKNMGFYTL